MNGREKAEVNQHMDNFQNRRKKTPALPNFAYRFMNNMNDKYGDLRKTLDPEFKYYFVPVDHMTGPRFFESVLVIRRDKSSGYSRKSRYLVVIVTNNDAMIGNVSNHQLKQPKHEIVAENLKTFNEANKIAIYQSMKYSYS